MLELINYNISSKMSNFILSEEDISACNNKSDFNSLIEQTFSGYILKLKGGHYS